MFHEYYGGTENLVASNRDALVYTVKNEGYKELNIWIDMLRDKVTIDNNEYDMGIALLAYNNDIGAYRHICGYYANDKNFHKVVEEVYNRLHDVGKWLVDEGYVLVKQDGLYRSMNMLCVDIYKIVRQDELKLTPVIELLRDISMRLDKLTKAFNVNMSDIEKQLQIRLAKIE